jgi:hypothetical protein
VDADKRAALRRGVARRPCDLERLDFADFHRCLIQPPLASSCAR